MIAALFVAAAGPYFGLANVDPWDKARDARLYSGLWPVVAHPPCERWGRYWGGGPNVKTPCLKGDDGGCFAAALRAVRGCGGVLEHPEASAAWGAYGLARPPRRGGWIVADVFGGFTCCVEQGHYGHPARKATWLYICRAFPLPLIWGASTNKRRLDAGFRSTQARRDARARGEAPQQRLTSSERIHTPIAFRDLLLSIAASVQSA